MWICENVWPAPTIRRTLRSDALGKNLSFGRFSNITFWTNQSQNKPIIWLQQNDSVPKDGLKSIRGAEHVESCRYKSIRVCAYENRISGKAHPELKTFLPAHVLARCKIAVSPREGSSFFVFFGGFLPYVSWQLPQSHVYNADTHNVAKAAMEFAQRAQRAQRARAQRAQRFAIGTSDPI